MGKIAFVFPGQGAQYPGMGASLCAASEAARDIFARAERVMPGLREMCFHGDTDALAQTDNTQPCLFTVNVAAAAALRERGVTPDAVAGFSLGELSAVAVSGMLPFDEALRLVMERGRQMQACAEKYPGVMAAVLRLTSEQVEAVASRLTDVYPVNYNSPVQTVVAMAASQSDAFTEAVKSEGGRVMMLNVRGAFHCPFMREAAVAVGRAARCLTFADAGIPVYANATGRPYDSDAAAMLERQVMSPVRWQATITQMMGDGYDTFIEAGAGNTLSGLIKKIEPVARIWAVQDEDSLTQAVMELGRTPC